MAESFFYNYASQTAYTIIMQRIWLKYAREKKTVTKRDRSFSPQQKQTVTKRDTLTQKQEMHFAESADKSLN
jgi:hypothetical protein